jgi:transposase
VYFIRTSLLGQDESTIWTIYNTLTGIEATFRVLKTDLSLRPVYHQSDNNIEACLFFGFLAYQMVATIRYQLKNKGINDS